MEQPTIHTKRLLIRAITMADAEDMFEMDSSEIVHKYLGKKPVKAIEEILDVIKKIHKQYSDLGIGRWAVEEKETGKFVGWTGFKLHIEPINGYENIIDLGYRFKESAWGKGYATETSIASMNYAFENWDFDPIYGMAETEHEVSNHILKKMGMKFLNRFTYDGDDCFMYGVTKAEWKKLSLKSNILN